MRSPRGSCAVASDPSRTAAARCACRPRPSCPRRRESSPLATPRAPPSPGCSWRRFPRRSSPRAPRVHSRPSATQAPPAVPPEYVERFLATQLSSLNLLKTGRLPWRLHHQLVRTEIANDDLHVISRNQSPAHVREHHPVLPAILRRRRLPQLADLFGARHLELGAVLLDQQVGLDVLVVQNPGFVHVHHVIAEAHHGPRSGVAHVNLVDPPQPAQHQRLALAGDAICHDGRLGTGGAESSPRTVRLARRHGQCRKACPARQTRCEQEVRPEPDSDFEHRLILTSDRKYAGYFGHVTRRAASGSNTPHPAT